jgi:hypothetical protein
VAARTAAVVGVSARVKSAEVASASGEADGAQAARPDPDRRANHGDGRDMGMGSIDIPRLTLSECDASYQS